MFLDDWPLIKRIGNFPWSRVIVQTKGTAHTDCGPVNADAQEPQLLLGNSFEGLEEERRTVLQMSII